MRSFDSLRRAICAVASMVMCFTTAFASSPAPLEMGEVVDQPVAVSAGIPENFYPDGVSGFLPICYGKDTGEKIVAITIDDCNQPDNLRQMIDIISEYNGTATIFPIGENVEFLAPILRDAVAKGYEIENHTQSHSGLYSEDDEGLAYQIWQQNYEVSKALGVDYKMHFLRPRGGDNRYDQRTHAYMRQMGYSAIAYWSQVGSDNTASNLMEHLAPGDIFLFHTTDGDLSVINSLVPQLYKAGYRMVTLNEMFGLPANAMGELDAEAAVMPLVPYQRFEQVLQTNDYLRDVYIIQDKLSALGYLDGEYNGFYGKKTANAVRAFQSEHGIEPTGICDAATWDALTAE